MPRRRGLPWGRWGADVHRDAMVLSVPPEARWAWWALTQEVRLRGLDGRMSRADALEFLSGQVADPAACLKALTTKYVENPLLHKEGSDLVVHDFHDSDPPKKALSTPYVRASRERRRAMKDSFMPPESDPAPEHADPKTTLPQIEANESFSSRVQAVSGWWSKRTEKMALAKHVDAIARIDVPLTALIRHLDQVYDDDNVASLAYFTSGPGIGRLRELESSCRREAGERKGQPTSLGSLLTDYETSRARRIS